MSSRRDIFRLKLAIEADPQIGHGTRALGLRVCSWIYNHPQHRWEPDEPFPLPWTKCSELLWGICDKQAYRMMRQLINAGHMAYHDLIGCPATAYFRLIIPPQRGSVSSDKNVPTGYDKKVRPSSDKKVAPLISNSLREEIVSKKEGIGSLRSTGTKGDGLAASPKGLTDAQLQKGLAALSQLKHSLNQSTPAAVPAGHAKATTGKPKTPGRKK